MAPKRKRDGFKELLLGFFTSKDKMRDKPDGSLSQAGGIQPDAGPSGFISHAQGFTMNHPIMTAVQGNQYNVQGDLNIVPQIMSLLSQHIIQGAAHDSSARTPPPRCHPDTRVKLIARITAWFHGQAQQELLLWITGPAGVGKSAIVQTFAEYLVKSKSLGASVFISRPNKRNDPHGIFITVAYQLAARIESYRNFIVERLSLDPELLHGDMQAQFTTFIIEPFVEKGIGAGGKRWGILLDGLDELQGEDAQCSIIQLISTFVQEHPDAPLLWMIASRPESHISSTFDDDEVRHSHWSEHIPINSTEACEDVERFLRSSFQMTQKKFRQSVPDYWPSETDFLKLTAAASGLFVYAAVVMRFIRDSDYADPVSRLGVLLSVIDRSTAIGTKDNPFVHLDALYHEILSSIPLSLWPTAKELLGFKIHGRRFKSLDNLQNIQTLRGMSVLFGLTRHTIYACLNKCRSILKIPDWNVAHKEKLTFFHASFADYLKDPRRSGDFCISNFNLQLNFLKVWNKCSGDDISTASVEYMWHRHCSELDDAASSEIVAAFHTRLFREVVRWLGSTAHHMVISPPEQHTYEQLCNVHMAKLCYYFDLQDLVDFVDKLKRAKYFSYRGFCRETRLKYLKFGHLDWKEMSPAHVHIKRRDSFSVRIDGTLIRPSSSIELRTFVSELEDLQERLPELRVVIFGGIPSGEGGGF